MQGAGAILRTAGHRVETEPKPGASAVAATSACEQLRMIEKRSSVPFPSTWLFFGKRERRALPCPQPDRCASQLKPLRGAKRRDPESAVFGDEACDERSRHRVCRRPWARGREGSGQRDAAQSPAAGVHPPPWSGIRSPAELAVLLPELSLNPQTLARPSVRDAFAFHQFPPWP